MQARHARLIPKHSLTKSCSNCAIAGFTSTEIGQALDIASILGVARCVAVINSVCIRQEGVLRDV